MKVGKDRGECGKSGFGIFVFLKATYLILSKQSCGVSIRCKNHSAKSTCHHFCLMKIAVNDKRKRKTGLRNKRMCLADIIVIV